MVESIGNAVVWRDATFLFSALFRLLWHGELEILLRRLNIVGKMQPASSRSMNH